MVVCTSVEGDSTTLELAAEPKVQTPDNECFKRLIGVVDKIR